MSLVARADPSAPSLQAVARLMAHGYTSAECEAALRAAKNDERAALLQLYGNLTGGCTTTTPGLLQAAAHSLQRRVSSMLMGACA